MSETEILSPLTSIEEISYEEIELEKIAGKGSFGVVYKGKWKNKCVAIKHISSEGEKKAFMIEIQQLSRITHPNIVKVYGACTSIPVCLIMEYAEGGSLYNLLHSNSQPQAHYTAGHAISWALQCAKGVSYLHNMKPKPLIHRDLKPPNLLLVFGGLTLKICDFGTACDLSTYMTNNKGSAAWMAPEVFEGHSYTEKCDVFSWGIILWEILSRRKPFDDIGGNACRILWAVHVGQRPPLLENCPEPIENLMVSCWNKVPEFRPSMDEIVEIMTQLLKFFTGHTNPLEYSSISSTNKVTHSKDENDIINSEISTKSDRTNSQNTAEINSVLNESTPKNTELSANNCEYINDVISSSSSRFTLENSKDKGLEGLYNLMDVKLRPYTPADNNILSQKIFKKHNQLAREYIEVQNEINLLSYHKRELISKLNSENNLYQEMIKKLADEKESLLLYYKNLKRQLQIIENHQNNELEINPLSSNSSFVTNNSGWVLIPRQNLSRN